MVFAAETKSSLCVLNILAKHHPPPFCGFWVSSVQIHCSRVYRQSQRHFNLSPRYLICRVWTLEGSQTKKSTHHYWASHGSHSGLVSMQTWRRRSRRLMARAGRWQTNWEGVRLHGVHDKNMVVNRPLNTSQNNNSNIGKDLRIFPKFWLIFSRKKNWKPASHKQRNLLLNKLSVDSAERIRIGWSGWALFTS